MNAKILEKAQNVINQRKYQAENQALNNKIEALENEDFKIIFNKHMDSMLSDAKNGKDESKKTKELKIKVDEKLKALNLYPIEPVYSCPNCNDSGRINGAYCDCLKKELNKILISESGFSKLEDFDKTTFDIFDNPDFMKALYKKMKEWCYSNFDKNIILLGGETGVGKTHLMMCMANELIKQNKVVTLTTSFAMNQDFLKSYSTRNVEEQDYLLDKYLDAEILFIDDLGTELRNPNVTTKYLYLLLNERKINKRPTIITTNLRLEDINDYYDERVASRIVDKQSSICVFIEGKDLRLKK